VPRGARCRCQAGIDPQSVTGIGVDATCSLVVQSAPAGVAMPTIPSAM
jgi:D-ribulokinase